MADVDFDDDDDLSKLDRGDNFEEDEDENEDEDEVEVEEEEESEGEDTDNEDEEEEDEEPEPVKNAKIPKSRLDEVIKQREEAKERNLWLEAQLEQLIANQQKQVTPVKPVEPKIEYDFTAAEEQYVNLIVEGEISKATKLRAEIDNNRRKEMLDLIKSIQEESSKEATSVSTKAIENDRFNNLVATYETSYPFLNSEVKDYNEEAVETVNTLLAGYVASGKSKSEALRLAVQKVAPLYTKVEKVEKKSLGNQRTVDATKKAAKASNQQPPKNLKNRTVEVDTKKLDVTKMSERDFNKLTPKELRILRGD